MPGIPNCGACCYAKPDPVANAKAKAITSIPWKQRDDSRNEQSSQSPRLLAVVLPPSRSACRFTKPIAGFVGTLRAVRRSSNRSRADERVLAVLRSEGSLPFRDSGRSGSLGLPDGDHCACVVELVRFSRVLPIVSRICHFCDSSTRRCPRRNAAGAGQGHPNVMGR